MQTHIVHYTIDMKVSAKHKTTAANFLLLCSSGFFLLQFLFKKFSIYLELTPRREMQFLARTVALSSICLPNRIWQKISVVVFQSCKRYPAHVVGTLLSESDLLLSWHDTGNNSELKDFGFRAEEVSSKCFCWHLQKCEKIIIPAAGALLFNFELDVYSLTWGCFLTFHFAISLS